MNICPKLITVRRKKNEKGDIETEQFPIEPTYESIASIKYIAINFDEAVSMRFLAFHINENEYCTKYKVSEPEKKICELKFLKYAHFYFSLEGYSPDESDYLVAFLPRIMKYSELNVLSNELCSIAEWLGIKSINCVVFRYGKPVHAMENIKHWQKQFDAAIKETKKRSLIHKFDGRIREISTALKNKKLTISKNTPLENINVS